MGRAARLALLAVLLTAGCANLPTGGAVPYSRLHFFATAAMVANVLFLTVILLDGLGSVFATLCAQS